MGAMVAEEYAAVPGLRRRIYTPVSEAVGWVERRPYAFLLLLLPSLLFMVFCFVLPMRPFSKFSMGGTIMDFLQIDFTKSGWRQFAKLNRNLGARFIKGCILRRELAVYIAAHENSGVHLDTICQEIRYEDGVYLLLMKCQGVWYITDIWSSETPNTFKPVFFWARIKRGCSYLLAHVLTGWQNLTKRLEGEVIY